jgi:hypothetical protein
MIFLRKIVILHTKYPKLFAPPSAIGKNLIFWRKIVIFHTKYPKYFRASLRSAQFFEVHPPPSLKSWIRPCDIVEILLEVALHTIKQTNKSV